MVLGELSTSNMSTGIGPQRTTRLNAHKATKPYPTPGEDTADPSSSHRRNALRVRQRSPCPRGGIAWICAPAAPIWDRNPLDVPHHGSQQVVSRFLSILTADLADSALLACAAQVQQCALSLQGTKADTIAEVVEQCLVAFNCHDLSNFMLMMRLIQLRSTISRYSAFIFVLCL